MVKVQHRIWPKTGKTMVRIPAGDFLYGERQERRSLPAFWIDRAPVTNADYQRFLAAHPDYPVPFGDEIWARSYNWDRAARTFPAGKSDHPVTLVAWYDAEAYAAWAGGRVPTEEEWEKAARGTDGRRYPWGRWEEGRCNTFEGGCMDTTPVRAFSPDGDSPYGCVDTAGNVWEWTTSKNGKRWIVRGGSFMNEKLYARCAFRDWDLPGSGIRFYGFRLVVTAPEM
jgi:formylglycine-generating enzyme required for sulfatase activity